MGESLPCEVVSLIERKDLCKLYLFTEPPSAEEIVRKADIITNVVKRAVADSASFPSGITHGVIVGGPLFFLGTLSRSLRSIGFRVFLPFLEKRNLCSSLHFHGVCDYTSCRITGIMEDL